MHTAWVSGAGDWAQVPGLHLGWQALAVVVGFVLGSLAASYLHGLRRLAVSEREMREEADRAASHVFAVAAVSSTSGRTGLLIYVSLFERRVVILADESSRGALSDPGIEALRDTAVDLLRQGRLAEMFLEVVRQAGERLSEKLPADRQLNPDELSNHLLIFHPRP